MGFISGTGLTGQGSIDLGGVQSVSEVAAHLEVPSPFGTLSGVPPVRRCHKQAWFGIGLTPGAGPLTGVPLITWHDYLKIECESHPFASDDLRIADTLYYDIAEGAEMYLEVDWP